MYCNKTKESILDHERLCYSPFVTYNITNAFGYAIAMNLSDLWRVFSFYKDYEPHLPHSYEFVYIYKSMLSHVLVKFC